MREGPATTTPDAARVRPVADLARVRRRAWLAAAGAWATCLCAGVACAVAGRADAFLRQFFHAYLAAWLVWWGLTVGSLALAMLFHVTGGRWGRVIYPILQTATRAVPLVAVLFLPLFLGLRYNFPWANPSLVAADPVLRHQHDHWLNPGFFAVRYVACFVVWALLAWVLRHLDRQAASGDASARRRAAERLRGICGPGLIVYGFTIFFASIDWSMSLQAGWYSSIYSLLNVAGQALSAIAFATLVVAASAWRRPVTGAHEEESLGPSKPAAGPIAARDFNDLGNLVLTFVILWAYMAFSQFLVTWAGNLPQEVQYYTPRLAAGWRWVALILILAHFFVPFALLLNRPLKRNPRALGVLALGILIARALDAYWLVEPSAVGPPSNHIAWAWPNVLVLVGLGGIWVAYFAGRLEGVTVVPADAGEIAEPHERDS